MAHWKFLLIASFIGICRGTIEPELLQSLRTSGRSDILINFKGDNSEAIRSISGKSFQSRVTRVNALNSALQEHAQRSQGGVQSYLKGQNVESHSFWSSNQLVVKNANLNLVRRIDSFPQVNSVQSMPQFPLIPIFRSAGRNDTNSSVEWGIERILAERVWEEFNITGRGVVVANIDSGVRGTHEALAENFRSDHGWLDPYSFRRFPHDKNGHGTHTMGTIVGQGGIGVAPGAQWIACRGCGSSSCDGLQLLICGQFMLAPTHPNLTDPRPDLIPDVICNSWGGRGNMPWYNPTLAAWKAAGIMHAFALGNNGPMCASGASPGDQRLAFAVGSTDYEDKLSLFSSKGPSGLLRIKPEISAPGSDVKSAWNSADDAYNTISGTSMAAPHVTGVMALMLSAYREETGNSTARLDFDNVIDIIEETAVTEGLSLSTLNIRCDALFNQRDQFPNTQFGYGRVDAFAAVNATLEQIDDEESDE